MGNIRKQNWGQKLTKSVKKYTFVNVSSSYERESGKKSAAKAYHIFQENIRMIHSKKLLFFGTFGLNLESKWEPNPLKMLKKIFVEVFRIFGKKPGK